jgi:DNA-binding NtrC family response regulator
MVAAKSILVIDESSDILGLFKTALTDHGFDVHVASSAAQALAICEACPVRIVLADLDFLGKSSTTLLVAIQKLRPAARVCLMTAGAPSLGADDLTRLGVAHVFSKPMPLAHLTAILEQQLL